MDGPRIERVRVTRRRCRRDGHEPESLIIDNDLLSKICRVDASAGDARTTVPIEPVKVGRHRIGNMGCTTPAS